MSPSLRLLHRSRPQRLAARMPGCLAFDGGYVRREAGIGSHHDILAAILNTPGVAATGPADPADVAAVSAHFGTELPQELLDFWALADGASLDAVNADLYGPAEALENARFYETDDVPIPAASVAWLPLLHDRQSNMLVLAVRPPLAPRVFYLDHEGGPFMPLFRDVGAFLQDLLGLLGSAPEDDNDRVWSDSHYRKYPGDYAPDAPRTPDDHATARALLAGPNEHYAWDVAAQLLPASDTAAFARLLETDRFTRRETIERMSRSRDHALLELLARDARAFDAYARDLAAAAAAAGLPVRELDGGTLRINRTNFDLHALFHLRHTPDATRKTLDWFRDRIEGRDPRARPDHLRLG